MRKKNVPNQIFLQTERGLCELKRLISDPTVYQPPPETFSAVMGAIEVFGHGAGAELKFMPKRCRRQISRLVDAIIGVMESETECILRKHGKGGKPMSVADYHRMVIKKKYPRFSGSYRDSMG